jgi:molecular chaperone HtpG
MITDEKFYDKALKFVLFKNVDGKYFTLDEYKDLIKDTQKDKNGNFVFLYATDKDQQFSFIEAAKNKGYDVLLLDGQLDVHFINHLEQKESGYKFTRVDADIVDNLIEKDENKEAKLDDKERDNLIELFKAPLDEENSHFLVTFVNGNENDMPITIVQSEFFRRMKDMSKITGSQGFYGDLPDSYTMVVNMNHKLVKKVKEEFEEKVLPEIKQEIDLLENIEKEYNELNKKGDKLRMPKRKKWKLWKKKCKKNEIQ